MSRATEFRITVMVDGVVAIRVSGVGSITKYIEFRDVMMTMDRRNLNGEIWMTEAGAENWDVFTYKAGDGEAVLVRSEPK